jgi:hypothetical protein
LSFFIAFVKPELQKLAQCSWSRCIKSRLFLKVHYLTLTFTLAGLLLDTQTRSLVLVWDCCLGAVGLASEEAAQGRVKCLERGLGVDAALACETLVSFWDFCLPADCLASEAAPTCCVEKLGRGLGFDAGFACDTNVGRGWWSSTGVVQSRS